jgi:hypothetical protein
MVLGLGDASQMQATKANPIHAAVLETWIPVFLPKPATAGGDGYLKYPNPAL